MIGAYAHREIALSDVAQLENTGFDCVAVGEHVSFHAPTTHSLTTLAIVAGMTQRLELLSAILLAPLYPPALLAKMVAELSCHSGGRFHLGIGVGGENPAEFAGCGVPVAERGARTDELLPLLQRLWTEPSVSHAGRFWQFENLSIDPRPSVPPRLWVGGRKEMAIRRAARFGDVWLPYFYTPAQVRRGREQLSGLAEAHGRHPSAIETALFAFVSVSDTVESAISSANKTLERLYGTNMDEAVKKYVIAGPPAYVLERLADYLSAGVEHVIFSTLGDDASDHLRMWDTLAADVLPVLQRD